MKTVLKLRRKRAALIQKARHMMDVIDERGDGFTAEERSEYDGYMAEIETLGNDIQERERLAQLETESGVNGDGRQRRAALPQPNDDPARIGMEGRDIRNYSLRRAIYAATRNDWRGAELEQEANEAVAQRLGERPQGFFVPADWMDTRQSVRYWSPHRGFFYARQEQRDLNVGTATAGGNLVATDLLASSFIDLLRNRMVLQQAGIMMLTGLVGDVAIPKQSGAATSYWVAEGNAPTESQQTVAQVALTPHTVGAFTDFTRKLMKQSSIDVELMVRNDLAAVLGLAIDYAGLHGDSGVDANQPDGVETFADVTSVVGGADGDAPDWADVVGLETAVAQDNADIGRLAYITNAKVRGKLKQTEKASGTAQFVWDMMGGNNTPLNGYGAFTTNQVRSNRSKGSGTNLSTIFFGNWGDLVLGMWGVLDILVDPYTNSTSGTTRVVALQDVDWAGRHDESFAAMLDAVTT
jgi:HK97 family phage major capsid protein